MKVFIVRHGETDWNVKKLLQGSVDTQLNQNGLDQAQKIANRLRLEKFDVIFSSPQKRALQTAQFIAKYHPQVPLIIEPEIREKSFGDAEAKSYEEFLISYPQYLILTPHEKFQFKTRNGESMEERVKKLVPIVENWKKKYRNKTILLATHGGIKRGILLAFGVVKNEDLGDIKFANTSLTILRPFDIEQIELLNDSEHLEG